MYSTKKAINRTKKLKSLHQKEDPRAQEDLDRKIKEIKINKVVLEAAGCYFPLVDVSASTPKMTYPLDKIIFKGEWHYLLDILELSQVGAEVSPDVYPSFVCNRVHKLNFTEDEVEKKRLACILSYITHLIKFKDRHSMDGVSSAKYHKIPSILLQKFSTMFADSESKSVSNDKEFLLVSYFLVFTLYVDDFWTDPSDIAKDLGIKAEKLRLHYKYLGCELNGNDQILLATLPVQLKFPELRRKWQRRCGF